MTYLQFHLWFNLPGADTSVIVARRVRRMRREALEMHRGILCGIVFIATTPWDNWAVHRGFWNFDWRRVTPVAIAFRRRGMALCPPRNTRFFFIETILVSLVRTPCSYRQQPNARARADDFRTIRHPDMRWHYFVHLVVWAGPLILLQWVIGWRVFRRNLRAVFVSRR